MNTHRASAHPGLDDLTETRSSPAPSRSVAGLRPVGYRPFLPDRGIPLPLRTPRTSPISLVPFSSQLSGATRPHGRRATFVALCVLLAACSSGSDEIAEPASSTSTAPTTVRTPTTASTTTSSSSTPDDDPVEDRQVVDRYLGFWEARFAANEAPPDPDDPALSEFATGRQLDNVVAETRQRLDDGLALRDAEPSRTRHDVTVISADADRAELQDCFVNDGIVYRPDTGEVIDDSVVTRSVSADMVLVDGTWKLERAAVVQEWEGIAGCALAG